MYKQNKSWPSSYEYGTATGYEMWHFKKNKERVGW